MRSLRTTTTAGAIETGSTSQKIADRNPRRDVLMLLNPAGESGALAYNFGADAAVGATMELAPGQWVKFDQHAVPGESIHVTAADDGHRYVLMTGQLAAIE